jgi:hypothetical protein
MIVGVLLVPALDLAGSVARSSLGDEGDEQATALAFDLAAEVCQARFEDPEEPSTVLGRESGESASDRRTFDDVDDYNGWTEEPAQARDGSELADASSYRRSVTVEYVDPNQPDVVSGAATDLKRVTVRVTDAQQTECIAQGLRYRYGPSDAQPRLEAPFVRSTAVELRMGTEGRTVRNAAALNNQLSLGD